MKRSRGPTTDLVEAGLEPKRLEEQEQTRRQRVIDPDKPSKSAKLLRESA